MVTGLGILGVAFAAACVWLGIQIVNRRDKRGMPFWMTAALVVAAAAYVGSYFAIVRPEQVAGVSATGLGYIITIPRAHWGPNGWRMGNTELEDSLINLFSPIWKLDRMLRPDVWPDPVPLVRVNPPAPTPDAPSESN